MHLFPTSKLNAYCTTLHAHSEDSVCLLDAAAEHHKRSQSHAPPHVPTTTAEGCRLCCPAASAGCRLSRLQPQSIASRKRAKWRCSQMPPRCGLKDAV